ncbi:nuclear protein qri2 [Moniliophthora roreri]|nr:nuclear protein qri2 [Moniliophthora roreri]
MGGHRTAQRKPNSSDDKDKSSLDWMMMGRNALAKSRRVPMVSFMLGPLSLSIEQKKRATVKRAKLEKNDVDAKKPQEIKEEDISRAENETTKNVSIEFAQSVENLFYLSFLIRDGKVAVSLDDEDSEESGEPKPVIYLCSPPSDEDYKLGIRKSQSVFEFDMPTWKRAIEVFDLKDPIIPHREKTEMHMRIGNKCLASIDIAAAVDTSEALVMEIYRADELSWLT